MKNQNDLNEQRKKIEQIDKKIAILWEERMLCAEAIAKYKKENNVPVYDEAREKFLIERNTQYINNDELKIYYQKILKTIMDISKEYQKTKL